VLFGFRPGRSAHDALQVLIDESWRGARWVAESDVADCFEAIPHSGLMTAIEERISDRHVLKLLRAMLRAGVMQDGAVTRSDTGSPQGGVISPVLCNVYICTGSTGSGRSADTGYWCATRMIYWRYARPNGKPRTPLKRSPRSWPSWAYSSNRPRRGSCNYGREARDWISSVSITAMCAATLPGSKHLAFLVRWPSRQAMGHARERIRQITARSRLRVPVEIIVRDINRFLRGWASYFRYGNSAQFFDKITRYALARLAGFIAKRHKRCTRYGWLVAAYQSPNRMGLINLNGTIVAPRPTRSRRPGR
jgi:hypothetical protein